MNTNIKMTLGYRIETLRRSRHLTQAELGKLCGWPDSRIGAYERGEVKKPTLDSIRTIAGAFGMNYEEFTKGVDIL